MHGITESPTNGRIRRIFANLQNRNSAAEQASGAEFGKIPAEMSMRVLEPEIEVNEFWPAVISVGPVRPICPANSELLFPADQLRAARRLQPQNLKTRHGGFWIEHSLQVGRAH
jgi:hypothetical protein